MTQITVKFEDKYRRGPVWDDPMLKIKNDNSELYWVRDGTMEMSALEEGMSSGRPSVVFKIDLPDGRVVFVETSLRSLNYAHDLIMGRYGDQI